MAETVSVLSPVPLPEDVRHLLAPRLPEVRGRKLGFRVEWRNYELMMEHLERDLLARGEIETVRWWNLSMDRRVLGRASDEDRARRQRELEEFAEAIDAAVVGLAA